MEQLIPCFQARKNKRHCYKTLGRQQWPRKRPNTIKVQLYADGKAQGKEIVSAKNNWTHTFSNLPLKASKEIQYQVKEVGTVKAY